MSDMSLEQRLVKFHAGLKGVAKSGTNPRFKSHYSTYDDIVESVRHALADCGLYLEHKTYLMDGITILRTSVRDENGDETVTELPLPNIPDVQQLSSYITYAKRISASMLLSLGGEIDDDANAASGAVMADVAAAPEPMSAAQWAEIERLNETGIFSKQVWQRIAAGANSMTKEQANNIIRRAEEKKK